MLKKNLCRVSCDLALSVLVCVGGSVLAQDAAKKPVIANSIRPFVRSETPANQAPDLYDSTSDEFNYFREDLGRQELSSRIKNRLAQRASRVVYANPMDKPAADGSPFVDIYSPDEVYEDGKAFVGLDDPDVIYAEDENNIFAKFAEACQVTTQVLTLLTGVSAGNAANGSYGSQSSMSRGPVLSMSHGTLDSGVAPGGSGVASGDPTRRDESAPAPESVKPSDFDDTQLIFPENVDNPYSTVEAAEDDFDFFKADRDFAPKPAVSQDSMMRGSMGGP